MRAFGTICIWLVTMLAVAGAAGLAFVLVVMPLSLDPTDLVTAGIDPWRDALYAVLGFVAVLATSIAALRHWHSARLKAVAIVLAIVEAAAVVWATVWIYAEYF